ncbi:hypothetical protein QYE76_024807 [Lolium multiflorum]|uniref:Uncharacterized protein n=1 Tax=Lolium multiflorum TaxID=4521 RepID=A0AAD8RD40_LOLMU|nr:hypothetical protein QYE76_024807 [Lolium multiflorum]
MCLRPGDQEEAAPKNDALTGASGKRITRTLSQVNQVPAGKIMMPMKRFSVCEKFDMLFAVEDDLDWNLSQPRSESFACRTNAALKDDRGKDSGVEGYPFWQRSRSIGCSRPYFAEQFTRLESENAHLRKTIKTSADQVLEANRLAGDAKNEDISLKDELKKLKQKNEG